MLNSTNRQRCWAVALLIAAVASQASAAQVRNGSLSVVVTDTDGLPLSQALVTVSGADLVLEQFTAENGWIDLQAPAAMYSVIVTRDGYFTVEYPRVEIRSGRTTGIEVEMSSQPAPPGPPEVCYYGSRGSKYREASCRKSGEARPLPDLYTDVLSPAGEPSFAELARGRDGEYYRLIRYSHVDPSIVVVVSLPPDMAPTIGIRALTFVPETLEDAEPKMQLAWSSDRLAAMSDVQRLRAFLEAVEFWDLPPDVWIAPDDGSIVLCCGGPQWIVEANRTGRYHYISRSCPLEDWPIHRLEAQFLELAEGGSDPVF